MQQQDALQLLKMGKNIFLTGAAGAGKTYLLNQYISYLKHSQVKVAVTASTGIAATHLQGTTIHSWSGIGVKNQLTPKDLDHLMDNKRIFGHYRKTKVLVIDEISMLHPHQLDMIDTIARHINQTSEPFGGLQIILCGDFFQLPPVTSDLIKSETRFAFESSAWQAGDFYVCYLEEQHRQKSDPLLDILNDIRQGNGGEASKVPLRTRYKKDPEGVTKPTKLYSRNINVDAINERELEKIDGHGKVYTMTDQGHASLVEMLKRSCLAPEQLKLKIGAEVMFIKNDLLGSYVNGTRCVVTGFDKVNDYPIVKTYDGRTITVYPEEWKLEDNGTVRAILTQIPLRLAWAITIHKSQGMTLDAAEIDLGDAFEPGMGYVALSRVRSLSGLKLMNLNDMALRVHPKVLVHDKIFKSCSAESVVYLASLSGKDIDDCHKQTMVKRFGGSLLPVTKSSAKPKTNSYAKTLELLTQRLPVDAIAQQLGLTLETIIRHIEKLLELNQIDLEYLMYLKDLIPRQDFDEIALELELSEDRKLKPIYEKFAGKYSYAGIQIVRLFV